jgi:uncharacterized membrane protein
MKRTHAILILVLAFCGLSDSIYIAQNEAGNIPLLCNVSSISGCNIVASSSYSHLFGLSIANYGVIFYSIIFIVAALSLLLSSFLLRRLVQWVALIGVIISAYLTYLEFFVIKALCIFCLASAIIVILILITSYFIEPIRRISNRV